MRLLSYVMVFVAGMIAGAFAYGGLLIRLIARVEWRDGEVMDFTKE